MTTRAMRRSFTSQTWSHSFLPYQGSHVKVDDLRGQLSRVGPTDRKDLIGAVLCVDLDWLFLFAICPSGHTH